MKLSELLDHVGGTVLDDRTDLVQGDPDELWSDTALTIWFNEAQNKFARESWALVDASTPVVASFALRQGKAEYELHKSILRVLTATLSDSSYPLVRKDDAFVVPHWYAPETLTPGRPEVYTTDLRARLLRLLPAPDATSAALKLGLRVARLPLNPLVIAEDNEPEIPEEFHIELCDWVAYRALSLPTVDSEARGLAREFKSEFLNNLRLARRDQIRAEAAPGRFACAGWGRGED